MSRSKLIQHAKNQRLLTHGIQLEITRLRCSSKHDLNIYKFNYQANTRSGGFLQKAHIRKARTAKRYESI